MVNEHAETGAEAEPTEPTGVVAETPAPPRPLVMLATDDGAVCVDDLCLPPDVER